MSDDNSKVQIFSSEPFFHNLRYFLLTLIKDIFKARALGWRLFRNNTTACFRHNLLSYLWLFLPPIITASLWVFLNASKIVNFQSSTLSYSVYAFIGVFLWRSLTDAIDTPMRNFMQLRSMFTRSAFPAEAILVASLLTLTINNTIRIAILAFILLFFDLNIFTRIHIFLPAFLLLNTVGISIGLLLTPFYLLYHDVGKVSSYFFQFAFYITPVVYTANNAIMQKISEFNVFNALLSLNRNLLTNQPIDFSITFIFAPFLLIFAWILVKISMPHVTERLMN